MKQTIIKIQTMLDYFEFVSQVKGRQLGSKRDAVIFAQSPLFDVKIHINSMYAEFTVCDRFEHKRLLNTTLHLCDVDEALLLIQEIMEEHTYTTL